MTFQIFLVPKRALTAIACRAYLDIKLGAYIFSISPFAPSGSNFESFYHLKSQCILLSFTQVHLCLKFIILYKTLSWSRLWAHISWFLNCRIFIWCHSILGACSNLADFIVRLTFEFWMTDYSCRSWLRIFGWTFRISKCKFHLRHALLTSWFHCSRKQIKNSSH